MKRSPLKRKTAMKPGTKVLARTKPMKRGRRSTGKPTIAQVLRFSLMRSAGCLCCAANALLGFRPTALAVEIHHITSAGKRLGHDFTIPLCVYHHQGTKWPDVRMGYTESALLYGPSMAREPRRFALVYGAQLDLLLAMNQYLKELKHEQENGEAKASDDSGSMAQACDVLDHQAHPH